MKKIYSLLSVLVLASASAAHAETSVNLDTFHTTDLEIDSVSYEVNPELGRARVVLDLYSAIFQDDTSGPFAENDYVVSGLSYDKTNAQVIFTDRDGSKIVCASVTQKPGLLGGTKLETVATGKCSVKVVQITQVDDDGFNQTTEQVDQVVFTTGTAS